MSIIEVKNVSKTYKINKRRGGTLGMAANLFIPKYEKKEAVKDINFSIEQGEMVGFIGPNGAGKSTTVKMLSGILFPDRGEIKVDQYIPYKQRKDYVGNIGVVFGQKSQLQWELPIIDSFELIKAIYRIPDNTYRKNLGKFTEMLDMSGFINQPVRQLSLGQKMRADIVASLLHSPKIVFFDEPTIGVDVVGKNVIRNFIFELNKQENVTMIFTTHDMQDIEKTCNRLLIINDGKKVYDGTVSNIHKEYGTSRQIDIEFAEAQEIAPIDNVEMSDLEGNGKRLVFENDAVNMNELMNMLFDRYNIRDISISEPDIESIIQKIYNK